MGNSVGFPVVVSGDNAPSSLPKSNEGEDLQDLQTLSRLRCWSTIEQYASAFDSIHHTTLTAGNAPLHTAISNHAPLAVVQALVTANPPSVAFPNKFGNTPLHFVAWKNKSPDSLAITQFLLDYHPQAAQAKNASGNLPLHFATNYKAPVAMVQAIYRAHSSAIQVPNHKGQTPLDCAVHRFGDQHPVVALLRGETARNYVYDKYAATTDNHPKNSAGSSHPDSTNPTNAIERRMQESTTPALDTIWSTVDLSNNI